MSLSAVRSFGPVAQGTLVVTREAVPLVIFHRSCPSGAFEAEVSAPTKNVVAPIAVKSLTLAMPPTRSRQHDCAGRGSVARPELLGGRGAIRARK